MASELGLVVLDALLSALHTLVVLGNVLLWLPRQTRRLHLGLVLCTSASWLGLGAFYGLGYCVLTDWHWRVKRALGETELPGSFVQYALEHIAHRRLVPEHIQHLTAGGFIAAAALSFALNGRDLWRALSTRRRDK